MAARGRVASISAAPAAAAVFGLVSITALIRFVRTRSYEPFAWYRLGVSALVIAVIFTAAMSSSSGELNSLATVSVMDIYRRHFRKDATDRHYLLASRIFTAAWGMWARPAANGQLDHPSRVFLLDGLGRIREIYNLTFLKPAWVCEDMELLLHELTKASRRP